MNPSRKRVYWVGLVVAGLSLYAGYRLFLLKRPLGWQATWTALAIIPIAAIIQ